MSRFLLASVLALVWALSSCVSPVSRDPGPSTGSLKVSVGTLSRSLTTIVPADLTAKSYSLTGSGPGTFPAVPDSSDGNFTVDALAVGAWTVTVTAKDAAGAVLASGTDTVAVTAGAGATKVISLKYLAGGTGTLDLTVTWPADKTVTEVSAILTPESGPAATLSFAVSVPDRKASWSGTLAVGDAYLLVTVKNTDRYSVASRPAQVQIFQGRTSPGRFDLTAADFVPKAVAGLTVSPAVLVLSGVGTQQQLLPAVSPADATDQEITWSTDKPSVATVSALGLVTALAPGTCTVTAVSRDNPAAKAAIPVTVQKIAAVDEASWASAAWGPGGRFVGAEGGDATFGVFSRNATRVMLELYDGTTGQAASGRYWMARGADGLWRAQLKDLPGKTLYAFRAWGPNWPWDPAWTPGNSRAGFVADVDSQGNRFNPNKILTDPYARELTHDRGGDSFYRSGGADVGAAYVYKGPATGNLPVDCRNIDTGPWGPKSILLADATPSGTKPALAQKDAVIYEAHVKGLTNHESSANLAVLLKDFDGFSGVVSVPAAYRGTYKGAGFLAPYLKALGYTTIELLPVQETNNDQNPEDRSGGNFWGYMTDAFFAPDRHFSFDKTPGGPTREFKQMVKAFHDAGIEVYLDVVYNHTGEGGTQEGTGRVAEIASFRGLDNAAYYALPAGDKAKYWETTGCGNNFNAADPAVRTLILDSLTYWITEMGVDGFRFDLAPVLGRDDPTAFGFNPNADLLKKIAELTDTYQVEMVAEAWDCQWPGGYQVSNFPSKWAEWNGFYRDAVRKFLKGGGNKSPGFPSFTDVFHGSYGPLDRSSGHGHTGFADQGGPQKSVNFVDAHDGFTMADLVSYDGKMNSDAGPAWPFGPSDGGNGDDAWGNGGSQDQRRQQVRNLWTILMFSRGVPMTVYGDEFGRTQNGNSNPYNLDSVATWNNYAMIGTDAPQAVPLPAGAYHNNLGSDGRADGRNNLFVFARNLIQLRRHEPALRSADYAVPFTYSNNFGTTLSGSDRCVRIGIEGSKVSGGSDYLLCFNLYTAKVDFAVPPAPPGTRWVRIVDTSRWAEPEDNFWTPDSGPVITGTYGVDPWAAAVLRAVGPAAKPVSSVPAGTYGTDLSVVLTSATPGAQLRYTWGDGTQPGPTRTTGLEVTGPVAVTETGTLKVLAWKAGFTDSEILTLPLAVDKTAPAAGAGPSFGTPSDSTSLPLAWGPASDTQTAAADLSYRVVLGAVRADVDTAAKAAALGGASVVREWGGPGAGLTATAGGLAPATTYWLAVLVRDQAGNLTLYPPVSGTTLSASGLSVRLPVFLTLSLTGQTADLAPGGSMALTASASGGTAESWAWYVDGVPVSGAVSSSYTVTGLGTGAHSVMAVASAGGRKFSVTHYLAVR